MADDLPFLSTSLDAAKAADETVSRRLDPAAQLEVKANVHLRHIDAEGNVYEDGVKIGWQPPRPIRRERWDTVEPGDRKHECDELKTSDQELFCHAISQIVCIDGVWVAAAGTEYGTRITFCPFCGVKL